MISTYSRIGLTTLTKSSSSLTTTTVRPLLLANFTRGIKTIPQPPGYIVGTVNDAYVPPPPHKLEGSLHWTSERIVAIGMLPLVLAPFITGGGVGGGASTLIDSTMSALLLFHCHTGFQSCIIDYVPKRVYGSYHNYAMYLLTFGTGIAGYGIYQIETKEGGVSNIISKLLILSKQGEWLYIRKSYRVVDNSFKLLGDGYYAYLLLFYSLIINTN